MFRVQIDVTALGSPQSVVEFPMQLDNFFVSGKDFIDNYLVKRLRVFVAASNYLKEHFGSKFTDNQRFWNIGNFEGPWPDGPMFLVKCKIDRSSPSLHTLTENYECKESSELEIHVDISEILRVDSICKMPLALIVKCGPAQLESQIAMGLMKNFDLVKLVQQLGTRLGTSEPWKFLFFTKIGFDPKNKHLGYTSIRIACPTL